jgi:hypothetical protein
MARIEFRSTTGDDEGTIVALLQESLGMKPDHPMLERRHLHWKYWEPREDWHGSRSYALTKDGRIVAHGAVVPCECVWGSHRIRMLHVIDWAGKSDARGSGAAIMQHIAKLGDAIVTSSGSEMALPLLPHLGFKHSGTVVKRYVRPLRPLIQLLDANKLTWRLVPQFLRNVAWTLTAPSDGSGPWQAHHIDIDDLANTPIPWPSAKNGTAVLVRTAGVMKYLLRCPASPMNFYAIEREGSLQGYFVLGHVPAQVRLVDCWIDSAEDVAWIALVNLAVKHARKTSRAAEVVAISSEPLLSDALLKCGFHTGPGRPLFLRARGETPIPDVNIRIQMIEDDTAYLHDGNSSIWA